MKQAVNLVSSIENKVRKLGEQQVKLRKLTGEQKQEIEMLTNLISKQKHEIKSLEEKIKQIKIAKITETKEGVTDAKLKISELVREIDKCIGLLNT